MVAPLGRLSLVRLESRSYPKLVVWLDQSVIERQGYGRSSLTLLRRRILAA
jgi:hypothetical protein